MIKNITPYGWLTDELCYLVEKKGILCWQSGQYGWAYRCRNVQSQKRLTDKEGKKYRSESTHIISVPYMAGLFEFCVNLLAERQSLTREKAVEEVLKGTSMDLYQDELNEKNGYVSLVADQIPSESFLST